MYESPYMDIEGVSVDNFAIDRLHTWDLGPLQRFIAFVFWIMIEFRVWECDLAYLDASSAIHLCLLRLRGDLWSYYYRKRYNDPSWKKKGSEVTTLCVYVRGVCARVFAYKQTHTHKHQDQALKEYGLWDGQMAAKLAAEQACRRTALPPNRLSLAAEQACRRTGLPPTGLPPHRLAAVLAQYALPPARAYMFSPRTISAPTKL